MNIFYIFTLLGGLALFLFGMTLMGDSLNKFSSGKFEAVLTRLTSNPLKAVLLGTGITAIIQSSSATTVMVVGFVNAGIIQLEQSVGIIMGANIGTTVTSWLLSMTGIHGDNFWIQLLEPSSFSPLLAFVGMILVLFVSDTQKKELGHILLGFAILMTGMESMSASVAPLADVPEFTHVMTMFSNPILGLLVGAVLTAIIQSSSASVGILQALCATGSVSYSVVLPVIMGQNIGTCVTAIISSVGASRNSKRAALIHLFFNIIGTSVFLIGFYSINYFCHFSFMHHYASAAGIAVIHSSFNIFATVLLLPFSKLLVKLSYLALPISLAEKEKQDTCLKLLDPRFIENPVFALEQVHHVSIDLIKQIQDYFRENSYLNFELNPNEGDIKEKQHLYLKGFPTVEARHTEILDSINITCDYLLQLSNHAISEQEQQSSGLLLLNLNNLKELEELNFQAADLKRKMAKKEVFFSTTAADELNELQAIVLNYYDTFTIVLDNSVTSTITSIECQKDANKKIKQCKKNHLKRLQKGKCTTSVGIIYLDLLSNYEQIISHCSSISTDLT